MVDIHVTKKTLGDTCKPCECNKNINASDPLACDHVSGICLKCDFHTSGDSCERCKEDYYSDALTLKNCQGEQVPVGDVITIFNK